MHNGENAIEVPLYKQRKHHKITQNTRFLNINSLIYGQFQDFSIMEMPTTQTYFYKNSPEIRLAPPSTNVLDSNVGVLCCALNLVDFTAHTSTDYYSQNLYHSCLNVFLTVLKLCVPIL